MFTEPPCCSFPFLMTLWTTSDGIWDQATRSQFIHNVLDSYKFLVHNYQAGDEILLFGKFLSISNFS
jgi:Uncharacterized alpha/beta hydrolase domain (DUF2235)